MKINDSDVGMWKNGVLTLYIVHYVNSHLKMIVSSSLNSYCHIVVI
jgi:hypothetical protein